jgi:hypothetical protein
VYRTLSSASVDNVNRLLPFFTSLLHLVNFSLVQKIGMTSLWVALYLLLSLVSVHVTRSEALSFGEVGSGPEASTSSFYSLEDIPGGLGKRVVGVDPLEEQTRDVLDSLRADLMKYGLLHIK